MMNNLPITIEFTKQDYLAMEEIMKGIKEVESDGLSIDPLHLQHPSPFSICSEGSTPIAKEQFDAVASLADYFVSLFDDVDEENKLATPKNRQYCGICGVVHCDVQNCIFQTPEYRSWFFQLHIYPTYHRQYITPNIPSHITPNIPSHITPNIPSHEKMYDDEASRMKRKEEMLKRAENRSKMPKKAAMKKRMKRLEDGTTILPWTRRKRTRQCTVCHAYGPVGLNCVKGSGNVELCKYFELSGEPKCQRCLQFRHKKEKTDCGSANPSLCKNFLLDGKNK